MLQRILLDASRRSFVSVACVHNWGNIRKVSLDAPADVTDAGPEVTGEDWSFFSAWYSNSLQRAALNAVEKTEGAKGLRKVSVDGYSAFIYTCIIVKGIPVK